MDNSHQYSILILDTEINNLNALKRTFGREYNVFLAMSSEEALSIIRKNDIALVIVDHLPGTISLEFLEKASRDHPNIIRIVLVEQGDEKQTLQLSDVIDMGYIHGYITKPWEPDEIRAIVRDQLNYALQLQKPEKKMIGEILIGHDIITEVQLETALEVQRNEGKPEQNRRKLGEILIDLGYTDEESIVSCYALQLGMPYVSLSQFSSKPGITNLLPSDLAYRHTIVPIDSVGKVLVMAVSEPLSDRARIEVEEKTGYKVMTVCALLRDIKASLEKYYSEQVPGADKSTP